VSKIQKISLTIFALLGLFTIPLCADIDLEDVGSQVIPPSADQEISGDPFQFYIFGDYIGEAKTKKTCFDYGNLQMGTAEADINGVFYYDPCHKEGLSAGLSYQWNRIDLENNPYFTQKDLSTVSIVLTGFSERACHWKWSAQVSVNFDNIEYWDLRDYMNYDMFLWGRYEYTDDVNLHAGLFAQTGMKVDRVYPIVGIDWKINDTWMLNLIFPMNVSLIYTIDCQWNVAIAARFFDQIHRMREKEALPKAIWHYQAAGIELAANYKPCDWLAANIHAGSTVGGTLRIANQHYDSNPRVRIRLDPAPYAGAQLIATF
jgi:hypothetical protein